MRNPTRSLLMLLAAILVAGVSLAAPRGRASASGLDLAFEALGQRLAPPLPENPSAVWVVRTALLSPRSIETMVEHADRAGITDLFVQVRGRGDAYYESDLVPTAPALVKAWVKHGRYDPLRMVLDLAHQRGMRVHAWLNVYLVWSGDEPPPGHLVRTHPDWVATDRWGRSMSEMSPRVLRAEKTEGVYLDPGRREVVERFVAVVEELVSRYPVDGIHLDYLRYPMMDVGYSDAMRAGFRRRTGVDPLELAANERGLRRERGDDGYEALYRAWQDFKAAQVTALVVRVRQVTRRMQPRLILSAAVKPDPVTARVQVGQDWRRWLESGWVDVVVPMMYSRSGATVRRQARELARTVPRERVWAGIAVYNQSLVSAQAKIRTCRAAGLGGISIFSYNSLPGGGRSLERLNQAR